MANYDHFTPATLRWLEKVLRERIAPGVALSRAPAGELVLGLPGSARRIVFDRAEPRFSGNQPDFAVGWWDPQTAGLDSALGGAIPAPAHDGAPVLEWRQQDVVLHYDVPGLVAWMLCRHEEIGRRDLDTHERFAACSSHGLKHGYLTRPVVDEWVHVLRQLAVRLRPGLQLTAVQFKVQPSHDVDHPSRYGFAKLPRLARTIAKDILHRKTLVDPFLGCLARLSYTDELAPRDPYNTFDWLMDQSERRGLASEFYFICGRTNPQFDTDYEIEHPAMRRLVERMLDRGHHVGLHPSYASGRSAGQLARELGRLRSVVNDLGVTREFGARAHYLRLTMPDTLNAMANVGLVYDTSVGYADHVGFRSGTCFEYPAFDPVADREIGLRVRPLIVMDGTVSGYMGLGYGDAAHAAVADVKRACKAVGGTFTLLWHNSELMLPEQREFYVAALDAS